MFDMISKLISWLFGIFDAMSESEKKKIINIIVDAFELILRSYYRAKKAGVYNNEF